MRVQLYDNDPRLHSDPEYFSKMGSFAQIIHGINRELKKNDLFGDEWIGISNSLDYDFGFRDKKRFHIGVWESTQLPEYLIKCRRMLENENFRFLGLSKQVSDLWLEYGFKTEIVDIGADPDYWIKDESIKKFDKFTILSLTSCNFRSGIPHTIEAFKLASESIDCRLIVKNTDTRNEVIPRYIQSLKDQGYDIEYICDFQSSNQVRELMRKSHLLCYNPIMTSAGLPIVEAAAVELPCLVGNYCPTNIYPCSDKLNCLKTPIQYVKELLCNRWGLPYTFPPNFINEETASVFWFNSEEMAYKIVNIKENYEKYLTLAAQNRREVLNRWTWKHSMEQLVEILG